MLETILSYGGLPMIDIRIQENMMTVKDNIVLV